jgi:hypothetical protein
MGKQAAFQESLQIYHGNSTNIEASLGVRILFNSPLGCLRKDVWQCNQHSSYTTWGYVSNCNHMLSLQSPASICKAEKIAPFSQV